jgi:large subunit ribosomal protein L21
MFAILSDRGRQYKVQEGDLVHLDAMAGAEKGKEITFGDVLLLGGEGTQVKVGSPLVSGAKVVGVVEDHVKGEKTIAHHRVLTNSLGRRKGHRTQYTVVRIKKVSV